MAEIKNLKKVAQRILRAIKRNERIILYGDADLDGVASVIILKETLKNLEGEVEAIYFPDREKEGYGISELGLDYLKQFSPALLIALDCGIGNFEEVRLAKKIGFEVIIIDHHQVLDKLPEAAIIVDPNQKTDKYPFKGLANVGIVYKLSQILLKNRLTDSIKENFLELVALATIADMMPVEDENKIMIEQGLSSLMNSWRPGLRAFLKIDKIKNATTPRQTAQKIISALNAVGVKDHLNQAFLLLTISSQEEADLLAKDFLERCYRKQIEIKEITAEVEEKVLKKLTEPIVFEGESHWPLVLLGPVASKICQIYKKPTFIFKKGEIESRGAVRTPSGINSVEAMKRCSKLLKTYGGHPLAAGFNLKNENLKAFKNCLIKYFTKNEKNNNLY
ncbi:MAG: DHH family phosphoesterase [Patescibacteria group bacterium]|nr:DHH family phosphoesterase [Patescibacteria group bacterium]